MIEWLVPVFVRGMTQFDSIYGVSNKDSEGVKRFLAI